MEYERILILFGTVMGHAEQVAIDLAAALVEQGIAATVYDMEDVDVALCEAAQDIILCTSTYGNGDLPMNAEPFFRALEEREPDLCGVRFAVCALGDRNYDPFYCAAGDAFTDLFTKLGAAAVVPPFTFDGDPDPDTIADAREWALTFAAERYAVEQH
ncbi:MAG TPA: flavodoxin domain-containing protein [Roseiflexaceae bacterium]|jgi:flavodoxin|nr:flavodoxin domain-containing protein [Roseiflexaceae bacterium]